MWLCTRLTIAARLPATCAPTGKLPHIPISSMERATDCLRVRPCNSDGRPQVLPFQRAADCRGVRSGLAACEMDDALECGALRWHGPSGCRRQLYRARPISAREVIFNTARGPSTRHDGTVLKDPKSDLRLRNHVDRGRDHGPPKASFVADAGCARSRADDSRASRGA